MPYCLPSYEPGSARPLSQSSPFSSPLRSLRSSSPPLSAYCATWVLPASMTSGASLLARAAVIFWPIPSHSWIWILTSISGWRFSKSAVNSLWNCAETLSRISQTSTAVRPPPSPESGPDDTSQALRAAVRTSADPPASKRYFTVHLGSRRM
ncbi:hypothetical protein SGRI78S_01469 [Streptomyces griseus subsp. griseus]